MEYCVLGKDNITGKSAEQVITLMLHEYSRQLYGFTRAEFDSIVEYDVLIIMASYYTKAKQEAEKQKMHYRQMNVCQYCGGSFIGLFSKKCKVCGRPKDYT